MDLALNGSGDIDIDNADIYVVENTDAVAQFLRQKLLMIQPEWFLDESQGMPYLDQLFVKNPSKVVIDSIFQKAILETPGVVELMSLSTTLDGVTRTIRVVFQARTRDGEINFDETIEV